MDTNRMDDPQLTDRTAFGDDGRPADARDAQQVVADSRYDLSGQELSQRDVDRNPGSMTLHAERLVGAVETHEWARVKVTRRIVTEQRTITVPVRREEVVVEYLGDDATPKGHPNTVHGSTKAVASDVVAEYVLHEEVPRVELDMVPRERVRVVVDRHQSLVEFTDQVGHEEVTVDDQRPDRPIEM